MDPNQQPNPQPQPQPPQQPYTPQPQQPGPNPYAPQQSYQPQQAPAPQPPTTYGQAPQPNFDPNYLDSIAPPPPRANFFSGSFGKIFFAMLALFVLAVSIIVASGGGDDTADLQQIAVRLDNFENISKTTAKDFKSGNLKETNTNFRAWVLGSQQKAEELLQLGGVKKSQYGKKMQSDEKALADELEQEFEDARLNAKLDRVYARTMANETEVLVNLFNKMAKKNKSSKIRDYAESTVKNLVPIQKTFADFVDDGN